MHPTGDVVRHSCQLAVLPQLLPVGDDKVLPEATVRRQATSAAAHREWHTVVSMPATNPSPAVDSDSLSGDGGCPSSCLGAGKAPVYDTYSVTIASVGHRAATPISRTTFTCRSLLPGVSQKMHGTRTS